MNYSFFIIFLSLVYASYYISDLRYENPYCRVRNYTLLNRYGEIEISNDMLISKLTFHIEWFSLYPSCYLCQLSDSYCNPIDNNVEEVIKDISLTQGITSNFMVVIKKENDPFPYNISSNKNQYFIGPNDNNEITITLEEQDTVINCDTVFDIIILPVITTKLPYQRDSLSIVYSDYDLRYFECNASTKVFSRLDCSIIRRYYYIKYKPSYSNCILEKKGRDEPSSIILKHKKESLSTLTWYHLIVETVYQVNPTGQLNIASMIERMNKTSMAFIIIQQMGFYHICGQLWYEVLMKSSIEQMKCNEVASLYFDLKPFIRLSLQTVVTKLNLIIKQGLLNDNETHILNDLMIANDLLTRHCNAKNDELNRTFTIYDSLIESFEEFNREKYETNTLNLCASLMSYQRKMSLAYSNSSSSSSSSSKPTPSPLPYPIYIYQYPKWFFQAFSWVILYYNSMEVKSIILSSFIILALITCLLSSCFSCKYLFKECFSKNKVK